MAGFNSTALITAPVLMVTELSGTKHAQHGISFGCECKASFTLFRCNQLNQSDVAKRHYVGRRSHHLDRCIK
jgi:hypothetical protein